MTNQHQTCAPAARAFRHDPPQRLHRIRELQSCDQPRPAPTRDVGRVQPMMPTLTPSISRTRYGFTRDIICRAAGLPPPPAPCMLATTIGTSARTAQAPVCPVPIELMIAPRPRIVMQLVQALHHHLSSLRKLTGVPCMVSPASTSRTFVSSRVPGESLWRNARCLPHWSSLIAFRRQRSHAGHSVENRDGHLAGRYRTNETHTRIITAAETRASQEFLANAHWPCRTSAKSLCFHRKAYTRRRLSVNRSTSP